MKKVFELAKDYELDSKTVLELIKAAGINVKTPVSVIKEDELEKATNVVKDSLVVEKKSKATQFLMGIRRYKKDGKKKFSLLTIAFNPDTLELEKIREDEKRTESEAILEFKYQLAIKKIL